MNETLTDLTVVVGSIFIVIVLYKMLSVLSYCSYWAAYDTVMLARGLKENLSVREIVVGLVYQWFSSFADTLVGIVKGVKIVG